MDFGSAGEDPSMPDPVNQKPRRLSAGGALTGMRHCEESGAIGLVSPCVGCGLHDVMNAATISNKLTIPENSDMAKLPPFRPARRQIYRNSLFAPPPQF
jgi:hypothetical protein